MKHPVLFCCGSCILGLTLAQGVWGQTQYGSLFFQNPNGKAPSVHAFPYPVATARGSSRLEPTSIASMAPTPSSPYQHWQQVHAPQPRAGGLQEAIYSPTRQGSNWIEALLEDLPFELEQGGISLGQNSPFFLRPDGLVYRRSY
ncbi:hypothetical protein L1047_04305 [Synechococcus sp. Nb3U1]|uniref:hypothetical protein n=1 Tax=Synechococcus sp. Nb3U1 TaxID=1914529 RepID=UPI001F3ADC46|nr:hypothetical protein [Synechococcus sp. Nb3U1]MCF2970418.1 hypothetical protein [Synechococcus sp. Nb3U1]